MSNPKPKKIDDSHRALYMGRRFNGKTPMHCFRLNGEDVFFAKTRGVIIGYTYKCGKDTMLKKPERDWDIERVDNPEWEAADAIVTAMVKEKREQKKAEAKMKAVSKPALKAAALALLPLCKKLNYSERQKLVRYLVEELSKLSKPPSEVFSLGFLLPELKKKAGA